MGYNIDQTGTCGEILSQDKGQYILWQVFILFLSLAVYGSIINSVALERSQYILSSNEVHNIYIVEKYEKLSRKYIFNILIRHHSRR